MNQKTIDLTQGSIVRTLVRLALPIMTSSLAKGIVFTIAFALWSRKNK